MIRFTCPTCQKVLSAPDNKAGARVGCPGCKNPIAIPQSAVEQAVSASPPKPAPAPMPGAEASWLYTNAGQRRGPVSWTELQQLAASGALKPADSVWTKGMPKAIPANQVDGLFVDGKPAVAADPGETKVPAWKRLLGETKQIAIATGVQSIRPLRFGRNVIQGRSLKRQAADAQLNLGQKLYDQQQGDGKLRQQVHDLGEQAHAVNVSKADAARLVKERKQALCELSGPALAAEAPPPGAELEHGHARETHARLETYREQMKADRLLLFPADGVAWRRVGIGYGVVACAALALALVVWPESKPPEPEVAAERELKPMSTEEIYAASAKSVCLIKSEKGFGTGFLIRPGVVATNAHVLNHMPINQFRVTFPSAGNAGATQLVPELVYFDSKRDLAFLKIDSRIDPLDIAEEYEFRPGRDISVIGNPGFGPSDTLNNAVSKGLMSSIKTLKDLKFYQLDLSVNPGNSGGPVFDNLGQVIGVVTLKAAEEERISFCIPLEDLRQAIGKLDNKPDAKQAESRYRFEMVFIREQRVGEIYAASLSEFVDRCLIAARNGQSARNVFIDHQRVLRIIRDLEGKATRDILPFRDKAKTDPSIPAKLRTDLSQLLGNIEELKKQSTALTGSGVRVNINDLDAKVRKMRDRHRTLVEAIRAELGIDKEDLVVIEN